MACTGILPLMGRGPGKELAIMSMGNPIGAIAIAAVARLFMEGEPILLRRMCLIGG